MFIGPAGVVGFGVLGTHEPDFSNRPIGILESDFRQIRIGFIADATSEKIQLILKRHVRRMEKLPLSGVSSYQSCCVSHGFLFLGAGFNPPREVQGYWLVMRASAASTPLAAP